MPHLVKTFCCSITAYLDYIEIEFILHLWRQSHKNFMGLLLAAERGWRASVPYSPITSYPLVIHQGLVEARNISLCLLYPIVNLISLSVN